MSLSYHARTFIVESPLWDQVLHRQRVITRAQAVFLVKLMRFHDWSISSSTPSPGVAGTCTMPPLISNGCLVRRWLPSRQIQWVSMAVMLPGAAAATGEHRQRDVEVVVGVGAPCQAELMAHLRHANRALHRPEVRVCQRNVHRLQRERAPSDASRSRSCWWRLAARWRDGTPPLLHVRRTPARRRTDLPRRPARL